MRASCILISMLLGCAMLCGCARLRKQVGSFKMDPMCFQGMQIL